MLVDCGHLTISVSFVQGQGLLETKTFSLGGGHISADLSEVFEMSYQDAEKFKNQIVLSLQGGLNEKYDITTENGKNLKINQKLLGGLHISQRTSLISVSEHIIRCEMLLRYRKWEKEE